jgi:hypothetical protein
LTQNSAQLIKLSLPSPPQIRKTTSAATSIIQEFRIQETESKVNLYKIPKEGFWGRGLLRDEPILLLPKPANKIKSFMIEEILK